MLIDCTTKGCMQKTEAKLDKSTNQVICEACGNPIQGITSFTKKAMESVGQVLRFTNKKPFQSHCKTCNANQSLYVDEADRAFCKTCNTQIQITPAFLQGLKAFLAKKDED